MKKTLRLAYVMLAVAFALAVGAFAAPDKIEVLLNGEVVSFTDAEPRIVDSRTFIPFRAVFNALGFADNDITFDGATRTVSAKKGDTVISLVIGEKKLTRTVGSKTDAIVTDVAAFIDPALGRTYVPVRFVAESLGCNVGWDADDRTVLIDDVKTLTANIKNTHSILSGIIGFYSDINSGKFEAKGKGALEINMHETTANNLQLKMDFTADGITGNGISQLNMNIKSSGKMVSEGSAVDMSSLVPADINLEARLDMNTGKYSFKSKEILAMIMGSDTGTENVWLQFDFNKLVETSKLFNDANGQLLADANNLLETLLKMLPLDDKDLTGKDILARLADNAFTKNGDKYTLNYKTEDSHDVMTEIVISCTKTNDKISDYEISLKGSDMDGVNIFFVVGGSGNSLKLNSEYSISEEISIAMNMDGTYSPTDKVPVGTPPAGEFVIDLTDTLNSSIGGSIPDLGGLAA